MTLALLSLAQFLVALDYSIVYVALPSIGRLADRYGPRTLFVVAMAAFGLFSAAGGLAGDRAVLLAARGAQGLAAALLQPAVLALIGLSFRAGETRNRALVVWGSVGASGLAAGVV